MAGILPNPNKPVGRFKLPDLLNNDSTRHVVAIALSLILVGMIVAALLLSANEGALSELNK